MALAHQLTSRGTPSFFPFFVINKSKALYEKSLADLISITENRINEKIADKLWSFLFAVWQSSQENWFKFSTTM